MAQNPPRYFPPKYFAGGYWSGSELPAGSISASVSAVASVSGVLTSTSVVTPEPPRTSLPVASGGGTTAVYDNDFSSFAKPKKRKRKKVDTDGPPVTDPAPLLERGPPRSTKAVVDALLREASQTEGPKILEVVRPPADDDDEEVLELLLSAL